MIKPPMSRTATAMTTERARVTEDAPQSFALAFVAILMTVSAPR